MMDYEIVGYMPKNLYRDYLICPACWRQEHPGLDPETDDGPYWRAYAEDEREEMWVRLAEGWDSDLRDGLEFDCDRCDTLVDVVEW